MNNANSSHLVVRVRLGIDFERARVEPGDLLEAVGSRLEALCEELGVELDVLQVGVAGDPRWQGPGPENRVVDRPVS